MINWDLVEKVKSPADLVAEQEAREAVAYLQSTDWYVMRKLEVGTPVPEDVALKRAEARQKA